MTATQENFDYGMRYLDIVFHSGDIGWESEKLPKRYILVNPEDCKNNITGDMLMCAWRGTGHTEWEGALAYLFITALLQAFETNASQADITKVFNRNYVANGKKPFSKEQVFAHIIPFFDIIEEDDENVYLKIRIGDKRMKGRRES